MSFFKRLFGKSKPTGPEGIVTDTLDGVIKAGRFDLNYTARMAEEDNVVVEIEGGDEALLRERDGQLLDALQFFMKRVIQHNLPESRADVIVDSKGYREETNQALMELADKLKSMALEKDKAVYFRALSPKDRKVVHQYLAADARVKSKSIGDGIYKKIKIFPTNIRQNQNQREESFQTDG